jgi:hypothetical protein
MFFGKNDKEEVKSSETARLLNLLFDKKLGRFESKAVSIVREIEGARLSFERACNAFEVLDAEPYAEGVYSDNIKSIKGQKVPYAKTLKRTMGEMVLHADAPNAYAKYNAILSNIERTTTEVLKANSNFKVVMYCYSNYLGSLKGSFATIERLREALRHELRSREREFSEYTVLNGHISHLNMHTRELDSIGKGVELLKHKLSSGAKATLEKEEAELSEALSQKASELAAMAGQVSSASGEINSLAIPLEKPSRGFDHMGVRKKQLHLIIEDPARAIANEADYEEFISMVRELMGSVEKGTINVKSRGETIAAATALVDSGLYEKIHALRALQHRKSALEGEARALERRLDELKAERKELERSEKEIALMEEKRVETAKARKADMAAIEQLFFSYYRKQVSLTG